MGNWRTILDEQLMALLFSGLWEHASAVHVSINQPSQQQSLGDVLSLNKTYGPRLVTDIY